MAEAVRRYRANPSVLYAEPDYVVQAVTTPNDALWSQQWDMTKISAPTAWNSQTNAGDVVVAIIDTGIDFTHPDLQGNLWSDPANGTNHGFTCISGVCAPGGLDDFGHGTHVAGTIGAVSNNGVGIAGINWQVQLLSLKFLDSTGGGLISDAVLCFNKVLALKQQGINIRVTSNSWGGNGFSQALKDAMSAVEAAGTVNVCAAGNSGVNADVSPMYPAAYDNRGIVSVLASDANDFGAGFTNYGLSSVDIAAPGVSTLSTVPTGTCALCDPSGYKLLSGTSMATPHVSGVMAALLHKNPALTANQARDVILDPASYDAVTETRAQSTSTGGRLNFAKALSNPLLLNPRLNNFPTLTMGPDVVAAAGSPVSLTATASDLDNDAIRMAWSRSGGLGSAWLLGAMLNSLFPNPTAASVSFTAPPLARTATVPYDLSIADGRGGGAHGRSYVTVSQAASAGSPPSGSLSVSSTSPSAGSTITVNFPVTDPDGGQLVWDLWVSTLNTATGWCCFIGPSATVTLGAGVYRIATQAIDQQLNLSTRNSVVVKAGGASGEPPVAAATLDKLSGGVPLTVNIDMSASYDPDGTIAYYSINCGAGSFTPGLRMSSGSCTFNTPGAYWLMLQVQDNSGNLDTMDAYVVATPSSVSGPPAPTPPTVSVTSPTSGALVFGSVSLSANASDALGIQKVDFYRDAGVLLGTATATPYTITWNSASASAGGHSLYAIATDMAANTAKSAAVPVTVDALPQVSISIQPSASTVSPKTAVTINAAVTPGAFPISRVDFFVNSTVVCSDTTSPYSCVWQVPGALNKTYQIRANAYDTQGQVGSSNTITVTSK